MNLDFFGLFDYAAGDGDTYQYTATEFNTIIKAITTDGVMEGAGNKMAVTANGLQITVDTGICFVQGRIGEIKTPKTLTLDAASIARKDRIVVRADIINRTVSLEVLKGTGAAAPTLTQTANVYEIPLATVTLTANSSTVALTDERAISYTPTQVMAKMNNITSGTENVYAVYA